MPVPRLQLLIAFAVAILLTFWAAMPQHAAPDDPRLSVEWLVDPAGALTLEQVTGEQVTGPVAAAFAPAHGHSVNLGYVRDVVWLRLTIRAGQSGIVYLSLTPNIVDRVDVHVPAANTLPGGPTTWLMGDHRPLAAPPSAIDDVVPLRLQAGVPALVHVRAAAVNTVMSLQFALHTPEEHAWRTTLTALLSGAWFGGMAILLVIQLVFHHYDRRPYFLLLAVSTFMAMLVYFGTLGLSRVFLFPQGGVGNDVFTAGAAWLGISASVMAGRSILEIPRVAPRLDVVFLAAALSGPVGLAFVLAGQNMLFGPVAHTIMVGMTSLGAVQGLRSMDGADASTRLRAAAFVVLWAGVLLLVLQRAGVGSMPDWVANSYATALIIHTVLLTGALAERLRRAESLNTAMREMALDAALTSESRANALVEERTRELAAAKRVAEDALEAEREAQRRQVRFMEVISHQSRTPLATIRTQVANIELSLPDGDAANRKRLARVRRGIARLVEVLEVSLARSRLQGPAFEPEFRTEPAVPLAQEAASRARELLNADIRVEVAPGASEARVRADGDMVIIAILNLLENASKFARPEVRAPIVLSVARDGDTLRLQVEDRGVGIAAPELERVFEARFRGSNVGSSPGTGTGLSLVARIAAIHGGEVSLTSAIGEGTTATLLLPLALERG